MRRLLLAGVAVAVLTAPAAADTRRVAVLDFINTTKDQTVEWLGPAAAATVTTKLNAVHSLQLVERAQLYRLLEEQRLSVSDLVDPSQAVKVGRLLGAEQSVLGEYAVFGGTVRFTCRFVEVATGAVVATSQVNGRLDPKDPDALWRAFDQLAQATIDSLNTRVAIVQGDPQAASAPSPSRVELTPDEQAVLARAPTASLEAEQAYGQGLVAYRGGDWAAAADGFERATRLDPNYAEAWHALGSALGGAGNATRAISASLRAQQLYAAAGNQPGQAAVLHDIGLVYERQARYAEALRYYEQGLRVREKLADGRGQTDALNRIGEVYRREGRYADALRSYERSLSVAQKVRDEPAQARALGGIGSVHDGQGRPAEALRYYERSLHLAERVGDVTGQAATLRNMGGTYQRMNRPAEASRYFERSQRLQPDRGPRSEPHGGGPQRRRGR